MLADRTVKDLLAAFASSDPTPGGGSASALAGAVGASLLMMVAALPKTRDNSQEDRDVLNSVGARLLSVRDRLTQAIDEDSAAYDGVVAAYKLPKHTPEQQDRRKRAIQDALRAATDVPLSVMRLSAEGLDHAVTVSDRGHRGASSDVGVAMALLRAALEGARLNVEINLEGITDAAYVEGVRAAIR